MQIESDFKYQGFCKLVPARVGSGAVPGSMTVIGAQKGVMRVNCIDCLDRTNVVQGVIARKVRFWLQGSGCASWIAAILYEHLLRCLIVAPSAHASDCKRVRVRVRRIQMTAEHTALTEELCSLNKHKRALSIRCSVCCALPLVAP
jgi:hypothetical protein